jgi:hypothetical protein
MVSRNVRNQTFQSSFPSSGKDIHQDVINMVSLKCFTISLAATLATLSTGRPLSLRGNHAPHPNFQSASWNQIVNTLSLYAYSVDSKNFEDLADVFAPDGIAFFPQPYPVMNGSAEVIQVLQSSTVGISSQHLLGSFSIEIVNETSAKSHS